MKIFITICIVLFVNSIFAQEPLLKFSGFVKTDIIYDSRETVNAREGHFLLYPANKSLDMMGQDINAKAKFNILSIQTRMLLSLNGPEAFGAKTSGAIEGEFFGHSNGDINGFRLRHAFVKLNWTSTSILIGQYWNPMFVPEVFAGVVSFNTGAPFQPFARNPQIRLTQSIGDVTLIAVAASQRDFSSPGPEGTSSIYLRNSAVPNLHLQLQYKSNENAAGIGGDYKQITPYVKSSKNYKTDQTVNSFAALAYLKLNLSPVVFKMETVYGENMADLMMIGGYAVKSIDSVNGIADFTKIRVFSAWTDISIGKNFQGGVFAGYTKNLGSSESFSGPVYASASDIKYMFRISPRIQWKSGNVNVATELEYTSAAYGKPDNKGKVEGTSNINNLRLLLACFYFF